jgi:hypothetical protein
MNFDKKSLSKLIALPDSELEAVIIDIAREAGVDGRINVKKSDLSKLRAFLSVASEEDILTLINRFGGTKK